MKQTISILAVVVLFSACRADDFHEEYYATVSLSCDAEKYNITDVQDIQKRYWLMPNGNLIDEQTHTDHLNFTSDFSLTIKKLDDPDFGYYYCLMVRSDKSIERIRHGVNVNGADFSALLEKYRKNAIIGGIAAGVLFVTVAGFCIVSHFRYQRINQRNKAVDELDKAIDGYDLQAYDNVGCAEAEPGTQSAANGQKKLETDSAAEVIDDKM